MMHVRHVSNRRSRGTLLAAAVAVLGGLGLVAPAARATPLPQFSYDYTTTPLSYSAQAGHTVTVNVYLEEEPSSSATSASLIADEDGLSFGAFTVTPQAGALSTVDSVAGNVGTPTAGFEFVTVNSVDPTTGVGTLSENTDFNDADGVATQSVGGFNAVFLGTVTVKAGGAVGTVTTFTLGPADGSTTNLNGYDLDDSTGNATLYDSAAATSFTVTTTAATPEPASLGIAAVATLALVRRRCA